MRQEDVQLVAKLFNSLNILFKSISPYAQSVEVSNTFKSFLDRAKQIYYVELGAGEPSILSKINEGYSLLNQIPKCFVPTTNCNNEHRNWGKRVEDHTYDLLSEFKKRGIDFGYSKEVEPFRFDEKNLLKIAFIVVTGLIIINLLKGK